MGMRIAIIPARGGSKRIPRKNIKIFMGKPMIAWSIEAAKDSGCFDKIIVSTDDKEVASIAHQYGAEVPFIRPDNLSNDFATTSEVIKHSINFFENEGFKLDVVCCIYATAPFIHPSDLQCGLKTLLTEHADYALSVCSYPFPIQRAIAITDNQRLAMLQPEYMTARSQDMPDFYHDAGQFYFGKSDAWKSDLPIFGENSIPIILPRYRVQDIDNEEDWLQAELMASNEMGLT